MRIFGSKADEATITQLTMKRIFLTYFPILAVILIMATILPASAYAQHSTAKEVAALRHIGNGIGKSLEVFTQNAKAAGFTPGKKRTDDGLTTLTMGGRIGDQRRCKLLTAVSTEGDKNVHHAGIFLQKRDKWDDLTEDYNNVRAILTEIYGKATECAETFIGEEPSDNARRMEALKKDMTDFTTKFDSGDLTIMLSITYTEEQGAHVGLLFIDAKLSEIISAGE